MMCGIGGKSTEKGGGEKIPCRGRLSEVRQLCCKGKPEGPDLMDILWHEGRNIFFMLKDDNVYLMVRESILYFRLKDRRVHMNVRLSIYFLFIFFIIL